MIKKTPYFDFRLGDFTSVNRHVKTVVGKEYVKQFIQKVIRTAKGRYKIYDAYGAEVISLIGKVLPQAFMQSEVQRTISEALLKCEYIKSVDNVSVQKDHTDKAVINITVTTDFGTLKEVSDI